MIRKSVYRFEKGGKGTLELPNGTYEFSYKTDGDKHTIDFVSESATYSTYTFYINDDALTLIGDGSSYV